MAWPLLMVLLAGACLAGCTSSDADLRQFIATVDAQRGGRIPPLPQVQPYDAFAYSDQNLRSPFLPGGGRVDAVRPDPNRPRQYLEQFPLDTLKMVGTLAISGEHYGLVQTKDGRVLQVTVGQYMGQNDGRITSITPTKIALTEIVPDGVGGYIQRPAALGLNE